MDRNFILQRSPFKPEGNLFDPSPVRKRGKRSNLGNRKPKSIDLDVLNNEVIDRLHSTMNRYDENNKENMDPQWSNTHSPTSTFSLSDENQSNLSNGSSKSEDSKQMIENGIGRLNFECLGDEAPSSAVSTFKFVPLSAQKTFTVSPYATYKNNGGSSSNDSDSMSDDDSFRIPPLHLLRKEISSEDSNDHGRNYFEDRKNNERKISIPPCVKNVFLQGAEAKRKAGGKSKRSTSVWITAFEERPRYMTDFEQEGIVGEGSFSTVFKSRNRLDGCLYAIKKLKRKMTTTNSKMTTMKEVCALAALADCPRLIRYYGCWIEDSHLWIQTELCLKITLDVFVAQPQSSFKNIADFSVASFDSANMSLPSPSQEMKTPCEESICDPVVFLSCPKILDFGREDITLGAGMEGTDGSPMTLRTPTFKTPCSKLDCKENIDFEVSITTHQFPEELGWIVAKQISEALQFMHSRGVAHLDIRPSNIFIGADHRELVDEDVSSGKLTSGLVDGSLQMKVGDLGMCCRLNDYDAAIEGESRYCAVEMMNGVGNIPAQSIASITRTSSFFEPLESEKRHFGLDLSKADMFSLGASLYELCKGSPLAADGGDIDSHVDSEWHAIRSDRIPMEVLQGYSLSFQSLVVSLMSNNPAFRPSASEVLSICTTAKHEGTLMMHTPSKLSVSMSSNSSPTVYDAMAELKNDCIGNSTVSHIDTLRSVLNDHRGIIDNIDPSSPSSSASFNSSKTADDIILDAASAIDRLVFELKTLRREQLDHRNGSD